MRCIILVTNQCQRSSWAEFVAFARRHAWRARQSYRLLSPERVQEDVGFERLDLHANRGLWNYAPMPRVPLWRRNINS